MIKAPSSLGDALIKAFLVISAINVIATVFGPRTIFWVALTAILTIMSLILAVTPLVQGKKWFVIFVSSIYKGLTPVELIDHDGESRYSIARRGHDGRLVSPVYWFNNIGECILESNGKVDPASDSSYVYFWLPLRKNDRAMHALMTEIPDLSQMKTLYKAERRAILNDAYNGARE